MLKPEGTLMIDAGAVRALAEGKSLLPAGIRQIDGRFERGDAVLVKDREGREIARGLAAYSAATPSASPASAPSKSRPSWAIVAATR